MAPAQYGLVTAVGLFLVWRRIFHPAIPYLFVTFDVVLVVAQVLIVTHSMGMQSVSVFRLRRPRLSLCSSSTRPCVSGLAYTAILFVLLIELLLFFPAVSQPHPMGRMPPIARDRMAALLNYQVLPLTLVGLAGFILFVSVPRTRGLLLAD
jgi:hypothetical protein